jgi:TatD DNase family protein
MRIDAHLHLDMCGEDAAAAIAEIEEHRIFSISVALDADAYAATKKLAGDCPFVLPAFGIHPWMAPDHVDRLDQLGALVAETPMIGEIGLDHHWVKDPGAYPAQMRVLEFFLDAARDQDKVVNLHTKGAEHEIVEALRCYDTRRAIAHWYSGPMDAFGKLAELGVYFTVGVEVLRSDAIREVARAIPPERLLTETDNPGASRWHATAPGRPRLLLEVLDELARVLGRSTAAVEEQVRENFLALADGDDRLLAPFERAEES